MASLEKLNRLVEAIIEGNNIDVDSTELLLDIELSEKSRVFSVKMPYKRLSAYIVDTPEGARIASEPEIVGGEFFNLNLKAALEATSAMKQILDFDKPILFLHVLRASTGYMLHKAFSSLNIQFSEAFVRVKYVTGSYRDHVQRRVVVAFRKFEKIPEGDITLVIADTVATGLSLEAALRTAYEELSKGNSRIEDLILYGFISKEGIEKTYDVSQRLGIRKLYVFAMQDITPLAYNKYDMPLYGPDESYWSERGKLKTLGSIVDIATLKRMLPEYAPGMDQPGDWSERQDSLFNGYGYEPGNIAGHLDKSLSLLKKLREIVRTTPWYCDWIGKIFEKRQRKLEDALKRISKA